MPSQNHFEKLREGVEHWNAWREEYPDITPLLTGENLDGANLSGVKLSGAKITKARFCRTNLTGADLSYAIISQTQFDNADLSNAIFHETECTKGSFKHAILTGCSLDGSRFANSQFAGAVGDKVEAKTSIKQGSRNLPIGVLPPDKRPHFTKCDFNSARLVHSEFEAVFQKCGFCNAELQSASFSDSKVSKCDFSEAKLPNVHFFDSKLIKSNFHGAILRGATFQGTSLNSIDLRGAQFDINTKFGNARFKGVLVNRDDATSIQNKLKPEQIEGLLMGSDLDRLKRDFTGFKRWLHLAAILLFIAPYLLYLVRIELSHEAANQMQQLRWYLNDKVNNDIDHSAAQLIEAVSRQFPNIPMDRIRNHVSRSTAELKQTLSSYLQGSQQPPEKSIYILMWEYIKRHDIGTAPDLLDRVSIYFFYILLGYNFLRLTILYKTSRLEHEENITNLAANFSFKDYPTWGYLYGFMMVITIPYYGVILLHTWQYLRSARYCFP